MFRTSMDDDEQLFREMRASSAASGRESLQIDVNDGISRRYRYLAWIGPLSLVFAAVLVACLIGNPNCKPEDSADGDIAKASLAACELQRDIYTYMGAMLSLAGSFAVFISGRYMVHWNLHPNPLIYYKMVADFMLALVTLSSQNNNHKCGEGDVAADFPCDNCTPDVAAWTQFCVLASETWFFIMALDLNFSLQNPFSSFKEKYERGRSERKEGAAASTCGAPSSLAASKASAKKVLLLPAVPHRPLLLLLLPPQPPTTSPPPLNLWFALASLAQVPVLPLHVLGHRLGHGGHAPGPGRRGLRLGRHLLGGRQHRIRLSLLGA
jgi:hypothetical protein